MRASGRTKRMLLRAILEFLEGNDVIVTAYSPNYSRKLCIQCFRILDAMHLENLQLDKKREIEFNKKLMKFRSYKEVEHMEHMEHYFRYSNTKTKIFEDHY